MSALAVVVKGYPRLSETFIAQEIRNLELSGIEITLFSLRHPTDKQTHPVNDEIVARVNYLPEYLYQQPGRVFRAWRATRKNHGFKQALQIFLKDLKRELSFNRVRRFGQAMVLAAELPRQISSLYAHFLHTPGSVARYAAIINSIPWACSAHAKDIYTIPDWEVREKLKDCRWLTTCTRSNVEFLRSLSDTPAKIILNYHGLDLQRFAGPAQAHSARDGSERDAPVVILSVGRAVEKKGYRGLLDALALLDESLHWKLIHIGGGPLLSDLNRHAMEVGIEPHIKWLGAQTQQVVLDHYRSSDLFALNCCIDQHDDRDGLPNVMVEAQSQSLPVVSTAISGIPELIRHGENGLLVQPGGNQPLAEALSKLITNPTLRREMGQTGRAKVLEEFDMNICFNRLELMVKELITS